VIGVNRVGEGGRLTYVGDSAVIDPMGEVLASASRGETLVLADVVPEVVRATRKRFPFLADRRT
jgi:predicted amidohydrolase